MQWRRIDEGPPHQLIRFPHAEMAAWDAIHNSVAKRRLRLRRQLSPSIPATVISLIGTNPVCHD